IDCAYFRDLAGEDTTDDGESDTEILDFQELSVGLRFRCIQHSYQLIMAIAYEVTSHPMTRVGFNQLRFDGLAPFQLFSATRYKLATNRQIQDARYIAGNRPQPALPFTIYGG